MAGSVSINRRPSPGRVSAYATSPKMAGERSTCVVSDENNDRRGASLSGITPRRSERLRLKTLNSLAILDTAPEPYFDLVCRMAQDLFEAEVALISLVDRDRQWFKAKCGLEVEGTTREVAFCNYTIRSDGICVVPDALKDPRFSSNPLVTGAPFIRFYAGAPLIIDGYAVGTLCVVDPKPHNPSSLKTSRLRDLAAAVVMLLKLHQEKAAASALANERMHLLEKLERQSQSLWHSARYDSLTEIPNRAFYHEKIRDILAAASRENTKVALAVVDMDHLKQVNDTAGHSAGDELLKDAAKILREHLRKTDFVARLGGDEFAIILPGLQSTAQAVEILHSIQKRLCRLGVSGQVLSSASIGLSVFPDHAVGTADLLKKADVALYAAKKSCRGGTILFSPDMTQTLARKIELETEVRRALKANMVFPFYQPKICTSSGRVVGLEALIRWKHPTNGLQLPGSIAELLDDPVFGCILGDRMMKCVLADMGKWAKRGISFGKVFVNCSAAELRSTGFAESLIRRLQHAKVDPGSLGLELTETGFFDSKTKGLLRELQMLRAAGISVMLDDFGTGFGSLTHLIKFPISGIKIDRSFVKALDSEPHARAVVVGIMGLAKNLGLDLVAEGIETLEQLAFFKDARCPSVQGYLFSKPVPSNKVPGLFKAMPEKFRRIEMQNTASAGD